MKPVRTLRAPRIKTIATYTAATASVTAAVVASSLLMGGCVPVPCTNPNGCGPKPLIKITLNAAAGTHSGPQTVNITAPGAQAIYFSTDGTTPGASNCTAWDGNPIPVNDSTVLRVFALGDGINYRSKALTAEYKLTSSAYVNRTALNEWVLLEKAALTSLYCANNDCVVPAATVLQEEFHWSANCPDGGAVTFDNDPYSLSSTFTYTGCSGNGVTADGAVTLTLDSTKLPTIIVNGSGSVVTSGNGYTASIVDNTRRQLYLTGVEGGRAGSYDVGCLDAGCAAGDASYYYGKSSSLWIIDPAVPNSCTP